jgi:hypothetical protein
LVNLLEMLGHGLAVFPAAEVQGLTHQMHDTGLDGRLWVIFCPRPSE